MIELLLLNVLEHALVNFAKAHNAPRIVHTVTTKKLQAQCNQNAISLKLSKNPLFYRLTGVKVYRISSSNVPATTMELKTITKNTKSAFYPAAFFCNEKTHPPPPPPPERINWRFAQMGQT